MTLQGPYVQAGYWEIGYAEGDEWLYLISELQDIAPSAIIELFELQLDTDIQGSNTIYRFHAGTNATGTNGNMVWAGNTYQAFPIEAEGFEYSGNGQLPRPKIRVSNILGTITAIILATPLEGAKVTRIRTMARYLDAVNFPARRNLLLQSEQFDTAAWTKTRSSIQANATYAPNGELTADKLVEDTTNNTHVISQIVTKSAVADFYTGSIYVKAAERSYARIYLYGSSSANRIEATINLSDGTIAYVTSNGTFTAGTCVVTPQSDGWYRIAISGLTDTSTTIRLFVAPSLGPSASNASYTGDGSSGIYIWGEQIENNATATDYQFVGATWSQNPYGTPDPTAEFPREVYYIDRKSAETRDVVEFELAAAFDLVGVRAPKRQCISNICQWVYRSAECGYTEATYYDENDNKISNALLDVCGKKLSSCKIRFGSINTTGSVTKSSTTLTVESTAELATGQAIYGFGVASGATISSITNSTTLVMSATATCSTTQTQSATPSATASSMTVTTGSDLLVGMPVSGTYIPSGTTISAIVGNTVTLSARPYSFTRSGTFNTYFNSVYLSDISSITAGMRVFGTFGIDTTVASIYLNHNVVLTTAVTTAEDDAAVTLYFMPASPSAATYTFDVSNAFTFRTNDDVLPFGSFPGVGTYFT